MSFWAGDNVHPNDAGHDAIAAMLFEALTETIPGLELEIEFAPDYGPFDEDPVWVWLSDRVFSVEWTDGKQADLDDFPPGEATLVLKNDDRRFDPEYTAGPYYGKLLPRVPFRIRALYNDTIYDLFYGFVEDGWEQGYQPPEGSTCTVRLVDLLTVIQGFTLPGVFETAVKSVGPLGFWILDGPEGTTSVADLAGSNHGTVSGEPKFGSTDLAVGLGSAAEFNGVADRIDITRGQILDQSGADYEWSIVAVFRTSTAAEALSYHPIFFQSNGNSPAAYALFGIETDGTLSWIGTGAGNGGGVAYKTDVAVTDGRTHIGFGDNGGISIDSPTLGTTTYSPFAQGGSGVAIGGTPLAPAGYDDNYFEGAISAVAVFEDLTLTDRQTIYDGYVAMEGETSGTQIQWALDTIGVPSSLYSLADGVSIMGPAETRGVNALDFLRTVARTEQGALYVDHADGGKIRFDDRYHSFTATRSLNTQATFTDDPSTVADPYTRVEPGTLQLEPNGVQTVINQASVSWLGGTEVVDESAGSPYGPRPVQIDTVATTAAVARGVGQWIVALNASPQTRVRSLGINPGATADFGLALGTRIRDRVAYRSHPQQVGSAYTKTLEVQGRHHVVSDVAWQTEFFLTAAPAEGVTLFTLGTSELDGTDILAY